MQIQHRATVQVEAEGLADDVVRAAHFEPMHDVSRAVRDALDRAGTAATLCVLPQGPQTIPFLASAL